MNNTLANGLALLELLSSTADSFSVTELAARLQAPKSHVHRLLQTLVERGYALQDADRRYRIGLQPLLVSSALLANHPLRRLARPELHRLAQRTGMDALLAIPHHDGCGLILAADYAAGQQKDPSSAIGGRLKRGATATAQLFAATIPGFDPESGLPARRRQQILRDGYALKDPTLTSTVNGIAVPIRDHADQVVAALGLSGGQEHFAASYESAARELAAAAATIRNALPSPITV